jgi:predicted negative regulator of RcsB-dependent stress response
MNTIAYPNSFNAFDSLGEAYMNKGDKVSAIKNYEKSLQIDPANGNAIEMLKRLKTND